MLLREKFEGREYTIDTIKVGENASFKMQITEDMQEAFLKLSGDNNPVHTDPAYAVAQGYADILVYGFLTVGGGVIQTVWGISPRTKLSASGMFHSMEQSCVYW